MALDVKSLSTEGGESSLHITQLIKDEHTASNDEFDDLFDGIKRDAEAKQLANSEEEPLEEEPTEEPSQDESSEKEPSEETPTDNDEASDEEPDTASTEEFTSIHQLAIEHHLLLEHRYYEDSLNALGYSQETIDGFISSAVDTAAYSGAKLISGAGNLAGSAISGTASMAWQGAGALGSMLYRNLIKSEDGQDMLLTKLAKLGLEYGKSGLLHFSKGVFYALSATAAGLVSGSKLLVRTLRKRGKSYRSFKSRIVKARDILKVINETGLKDKKLPTEVYDDHVTISMLKVGSDLDFHKHLATMYKLLATYDSKMPMQIATCSASTRSLISEVMSGKTDIPETGFVDRFQLPNMKSAGSRDGVEVLKYQYILPGDKVFCADVPDSNLDDYDAIKSAYHESKAYISIDGRSQTESVEECRYLNIDEIGIYLDILEKLCDEGLSLDSQFKEAEKYRKKLKPSIGSYIDYLASKERDLTIKESLAEFVSLKVAFMDHVVIGGHLKLHDLNTTILSAAMSYVKASLARYR
jgi:hypothetical protein